MCPIYIYIIILSQDLKNATKMSKREEKKIARKNLAAVVKQDQGASACSMCSSSYKAHVSSLESNSHLFAAPLTPANYQERFHHLLWWEEREHIKQLAERLVLC